jgi:SAM-dependent methyltransferase
MAAIIMKAIRRAIDQFRSFRTLRIRRRIEKILSSSELPDTVQSEQDFDLLQAEYSERPEYGYDFPSLVSRACTRTTQVVKASQHIGESLSTLEIGAGDGMVSVVLDAIGYKVHLTDIDDWRVDQAKRLPFLIANSSETLKYPPGSFDVVFSYNTFDHLTSPLVTLQEIAKVLKPAGIAYLNFSPLYCSPWGLHAYRLLRMPYPQFLFREQFISSFIEQNDVIDLGRRLNQLQYVNKYRFSDYQSTWEKCGLKIRKVEYLPDRFSLDIILRYPKAFRGRGLVFDDVVTGGIEIVLEKAD